MSKHKIQKRTFLLSDVEIRSESEGEGRTLVGYAALFDSMSQDLGGFVEVIRKGAFTKTLAESDVRALKNHNSDYVLGRSKSGTLRLAEDDKGLRVEIDVPDAQWALDLVESIERGDIDQMSFQFRTVRDAWTRREGEADLRELLEVKLFEVSTVTWPAYEETEISARELRAMGDEEVEEEGNNGNEDIKGDGDNKEDEKNGNEPVAPPLAGHPTVSDYRRRLELAERI